MDFLSWMNLKSWSIFQDHTIDPKRLHRIIHKKLGLKISDGKNVPEDYRDRDWNVKDHRYQVKKLFMQSLVQKFADDIATKQDFSPIDLRDMQTKIGEARSFTEGLKIFGECLNEKLRQYFDPESSFTLVMDREHHVMNKNFMGGMINQLATTLSLMNVSFKLQAQSVGQKYLNPSRLKDSLSRINKQMIETLYGLSKVNLSVLRKLFNIWGHVDVVPPNGLVYDFQPKNFILDDVQNPSNLLLKLRPIKKLIWSIRLHPYIKEAGKSLKMSYRDEPTIGCPALKVKTNDGTNFIKLVHDWTCDIFEKTFLPNLDKFIQIELSDNTSGRLAA